MTLKPILLLLCALTVTGVLATGCGSSQPSAEATAEAEEEPDSVGWKGRADRRPGQSLKNPFRDPTELGGNGPGGSTSGGGPSGSAIRGQNFNLPYTRDSLKNADPLVIPRSGQMPYEDPGVPPIANQPSVASNAEMIELPAGTFMMGLTDEDPFDIQYAGRARVSISPFYLDQYEVTNADYRAFLDSIKSERRAEMVPDSTVWERGETGSSWQNYFYGSRYDQHPVVAVMWSQAMAYCKWENKRLPTEAEWEYAARAGRIGGIYPWQGFNVQSRGGQFLANYTPQRQGQSADGYAFTAPVGSYPPSVWGLYDMSGNVAEWVEDAFKPTYQGLSDLNPVHRDGSEPRHVVRGGSWSSSAFRIGVGLRDYQEKDQASLQIGFRCAVDPGNFPKVPKKTQPAPASTSEANE